MSIAKDIQYRFKRSGIVEQLIYINVGVYLFMHLFNTVGYLFEISDNLIFSLFSLPANFTEFIYKPWTIISYGFLHGGFTHILWNVIALYYFGRLFIEYFTTKSLLNFYLLGTFFGGLFFLISYNFFPVFKDNSNSILVGASAGVSAIIIGIATYLPNYQLKFPLIGFVKLWYLAAFFVALDIIQIPAGNAGGHLAHLGGALFGYLYVKNFGNKDINLLSVFKRKKKPFKKVYKTKNKQTKTQVNTSSYKNNQDEINNILDKISKNGYDTLTKDEKEFLFHQGKPQK